MEKHKKKKKKKSVLRRSSSYVGNVKCITLCALIFQCSLKEEVKIVLKLSVATLLSQDISRLSRLYSLGWCCPKHRQQQENPVRAFTSQLHLCPVCRDATSKAEVCLWPLRVMTSLAPVICLPAVCPSDTLEGLTGCSAWAKESFLSFPKSICNTQSEAQVW